MASFPSDTDGKMSEVYRVVHPVLTSIAYLPRYGELRADGRLRVPVVERLHDGTEVDGFRNLGPDFPEYALWVRLLEQKCEDIDLYDGWGNGSLHPMVGLLRNRYMEIDFHLWDWEALFLEGFGCPAPYPGGPEDGPEHDEHCRQRFRAAIPEYPLLGRIFDMYEDAVYAREEVPLLREESERARAQLSQPPIHPGGIRALRKILFACRAAIQADSSLVFGCD